MLEWFSVPPGCWSLWLMQYGTGGSHQCSGCAKLTRQHSAALRLLLPGKEFSHSWLTRKCPESEKCTKTLSWMVIYHELNDAEESLTTPVCGQVSEGSTALRRERLNPRIESQHFNCVFYSNETFLNFLMPFEVLYLPQDLSLSN